MTYYNQCKCGYLKYWNYGTPPPRCTFCPRCGSSVAVAPDIYPVVLAHDFVPVPTVRGPALAKRCRYCGRKKSEM